MTTATAIRPQVMARETFHPFVISSGGLSGIGKTLPLQEADDLDNAVQIGTLCTPHKGFFEVRIGNTLTGAVVRKFYAVRQKSKATHRYHEYQTRAVHDRYAEHLFDLEGNSL